MRTALILLPAALCEIAGCFTFWAWLRDGRSPLLLLPGCLCLAAFAVLLTWSPAASSGRAFAAYGGVYVVASLAWLRVVDGVVPDRWDLLGAGLCLLGAGTILFGPRSG